MCGFFQAAAGIEQHILARDFNAHPEIMVCFQVVENHVGEVMHVDDHFADSEFAQTRERNFEQRAAVDFDQRFGTIVGERTQARAEAGRENHRLHWPVPFTDRVPSCIQLLLLAMMYDHFHSIFVT